MSSTRLEQTRALHADIENLVRFIVYELQHKAKSQKKKVYQTHRIAKYIKQIQEKSYQLDKIYEDDDGFRLKEIDEMAGENLMKTIASFDAKLYDIREYHRKFPNAGVEEQLLDPRKQQIIEEATQMEEQSELQFSGEEGYGKYVDLHPFYLEFINLIYSPEDPKKPDYMTFLKTYHHFHKIPKSKKNEQYKEYLQKLYNYFVSFYKRTQPLQDLTQIMEQTTQDFEHRWANGTVIGWERTIQPKQNGTSEKLNGPAKQKQQNDTKQNDEKQNGQKPGGEKKKKRRRKRKRGLSKEENEKEMALLETKIQRFTETLGDILDATKIQIEKNQTRTWEERMAEIEREEEEDEEDIDVESEEEEDTGIGSNPLNLPLGWDGKPIPYWLYKLHDLGTEYKCEICGNYSYWGPRAFEKHFQEWRHAHGMRCLRIPNTRHFHHITKIADAIALWQKIKKESSENMWKSDLEEFEDDEGNVFNKKMYNDLKRQGLL